MDEMKAIVGDIKSFSSSSNMKNVMNTVNADRRREKFVIKLNTILSKFSAIKLSEEDDKRIELLFLFVMQSATDYLRDDKNKDEVCIQLLRRFVSDDDDLCKNIMSIVRSKIKPLTFYRRNKHMILRGLSVFFATMFSRAK